MVYSKGRASLRGPSTVMRQAPAEKERLASLRAGMQVPLQARACRRLSGGIRTRVREHRAPPPKQKITQAQNPTRNPSTKHKARVGNKQG